MARKRSRDTGALAITDERPSKKPQKATEGPGVAHTRDFWETHFSEGLFSAQNVTSHTNEYAKSRPYKHGVIDGLVNDELLRGVRSEVLSEIHYTQKETDIYKIHQSGDLANLDGLDDASLRKLPNLLKLRNALYSPVFREYLETVTGSGKLSGEKTDMAINIYTPGSHLLCHDDVIGSRRISYILYLTDPDDPWRQQWGGALRLYPTKDFKKEGEVSHVPQPDPTKIIYPAWNQLSFFAVQPGLSFHDVGEVYENKDELRDQQPMRVAISGWFHIPQQNEAGFIKGEAEALQKQSSLTTLQSSDERFDYPRPRPMAYPEYDPDTPTQDYHPQPNRNSDQIKEDIAREADVKKRKAIYDAHQRGEEDAEHDVLTEEEAGFLCKYINPMFLAPDQAEEMQDSFHDNGQIVIEKFLHPKFARAIEHYVDKHFPQTMTENTNKIEKDFGWKVAKPPHKHKYLVMDDQSSLPGGASLSLATQKPATQNELKHLLNNVFSSLPFRKWLQIITGLIFKSHDMRIRRFRRGKDYQLAKLYKEKEGRVEITLGLSTAGKWEAPPEEDEDEQPKDIESGTAGESARNGENGNAKTAAVKKSANGASKPGHLKTSHGKQIVEFEPLSTDHVSDETNNGGYEMFIRGDEDEDDDLPEDKKAQAKGQKGHSHLDVTGKQRKKADPAVYQAAADDDDDGILLNMAAGFNRLSIVLRDQGTMRFVKYVSERSGADRWDLTGEWEVDWERSGKVHGWDDEDGDEEEDDDDDDDNDDEADDADE